MVGQTGYVASELEGPPSSSEVFSLEMQGVEGGLC